MINVILVCNAGMSSSVMAKKVSQYFEKDGKEIHVDATTAFDSKTYTDKKYDMILVSPQMRMKYDELSKVAEKFGKKIAQLPFDAYAPIPTGIEKMAKTIVDNL